VAVEYGIITSVVPPGSWHYPQVLSSGQTVKITTFSFEQLLKDMLDFRLRHLELCGGSEKATPESIRADLKTYYCTHFRQNCADSPASPAITARVGIGITNYQRPIDRAADWLASIGKLSIPKIDPALAAHRAQICAQCPQNVRWATPCGPCNDNVLVRVQNAKGSMYTPYDRSLFSCRIYGHENSVAIWLSDTHSTSEQLPPANCWKAQANGQ
jgi:hypothetical protein